MCLGISILRRQINAELLAEFALQRSLFSRADGADDELIFKFNDPVPRLPVMHDGQMHIYTWGNRDDRQSRLPKTGWCRTESLEVGKWRYLSPEPCEIPAVAGLEKGVWFQIKEGIQGVVVHDEHEQSHVYMLTQPASHYYQVMTRHERMPVLIGQVI